MPLQHALATINIDGLSSNEVRAGEAKKKTVGKSQMTNKLALGFAAQGDRVIAADVDEAAAEAHH